MCYTLDNVVSNRYYTRVRRGSSVVEQRTHKPLVASSTLAPGTNKAQNYLGFFCIPDMSSLATRLENFLQLSQLLPKGSRCLAAVSGGSDSTALLCLLHELQTSLDLTIYAAHLDHQLRSESGEDRRQTEILCHNLGITCLSKVVAVDKVAAAKGLSLEEAGRSERYAFFAQIQKKYNLPFLLTAHTADDLAETVLMRLINGTGVAGLGAIRAKSFRQGAVLLRPLLIFTKAELCQYLRQKGQTWREDFTNHIADAPRTKVRLELLPLLKKWNGRIVSSLGRLAQSAQEDEDYFRQQVEKLWAEGAIYAYASPPPPLAQYRAFMQTPQNTQGIGFKRDWLVALPVALRKRLWRLAQDKVLSTLPNKADKVWPLESCHYAALEAFTTASNSKLLPLVNNLQVRWQQDILWLEPSHSFQGILKEELPIQTVELSATQIDILHKFSASALKSETAQVESSSTLELLFPLRHMKLTFKAEPISQRPEPLKIWIDPEHFLAELGKNRSLSVRSRLPGDRFFPAGGQGTQKLKKYLLGCQVPQNERDLLPLLCCGPHLIWVVGLKADQTFLAKPGQTKVISIQASPI